MGGEVMTTVTKRKKPDPKFKFKAGDRVKEIRKFQHNVTNPFNRKTDRIKKCLEIAANQRIGTVLRTFLKPNQNGARHVYVEVLWVIVRGEEYVSDCLNKEKKKLVSFTSERESAKYFVDHEKAKMTMRVLKGVVGPGFDLKRFFIQLKP
jgi:hypothetical protein